MSLSQDWISQKCVFSDLSRLFSSLKKAEKSLIQKSLNNVLVRNDQQSDQITLEPRNSINQNSSASTSLKETSLQEALRNNKSLYRLTAKGLLSLIESPTQMIPGACPGPMKLDFSQTRSFRQSVMSLTFKILGKGLDIWNYWTSSKRPPADPISYALALKLMNSMNNKTGEKKEGLGLIKSIGEIEINGTSLPLAKKK